ncbi:helix-turn-helix domain-containing protein [Rhizobiales bacterium L72]|uniref:Helix-turn-helix domain-containing protein n=2 Tax=Propylenella binzhouense TaxID=2555902 RepID=A0A964T579_9HYPH|nr:helix-turn-helix domain-containing protein [Propylenella binzhouense]
MAAHVDTEFMTTREVADLLRLKERRVYDLAAAGQIPCTRAVGKLLFQRSRIEAWLASHDSSPGAAPAPACVLLGSHDPLLDWAVRESRCGIATFFDGSLDGLDRFQRNEGIATGLHVRRRADEDWNVPLVRDRFAARDVVLVEWAWRERGFLVAPGNPKRIEGAAHLASARVVPRQEQAGSQILLLDLLAAAGIDPATIDFVHAARTESDAASAVAEGSADAAFGLRSVARQYRLDFVPVLRERFDLLVSRPDWFEEPFQRFLAFLRTDLFAERLAASPGYDASGLGRVHFNAGRAAG